MACFKGKFSAVDVFTGTLSPFERVRGTMSVVCPVNVAGPKSLLLDNGEELWYDDAKPFDFE